MALPLTGPALFDGAVLHRRRQPARPAFRYRLCWALVDLDELPALSRRLRLFGYGRPAPVSLQPRDHGPAPDESALAAPGTSPRVPVEDRLRAAGIVPPGGPIGLLCGLRQLGYAFNPISTFFCHDREGRLAAVLHEVHNTFGDRHGYAHAVPRAAGPVLRYGAPKRLHVSPYLNMQARYRFRLALPGPQPGAVLSLAIRVVDGAGAPLLDTAFTGRRRALTDRALARLLLTRPGQTAKITAAIHWQALKLHLAGIALRRRPAPPRHAATGTNESRSQIDDSS